MSNKKRVPPNSAAAKKKDQGMVKTYKFIGLVTSVCLVLAGLAIAGILVSRNIAAGPKPGFYVDGSSRVSDADPFMTVGGIDVTYNEYRYHYLSVKAQIASSNGGDEYWADDPQGVKAAQVKKDTEVRLKEWYIMQQYAVEKGIGLSKDEQSKIDNELRTIREQQGDQLDAWLRERYLADADMYKIITRQSEIAKKVDVALLENLKKDAGDDWQDSVVSAQHVLIQIAKDATDEQWEDGLKTAQKVADRANAATSANRDLVFKQLREEFDADSSQPQKGYTFGAGKMVDEFYEAAIKLEVGEVSEPVKTDFGYHVIMRLELDAEELEKEKDTIQETYFKKLQADELDKRKKVIVIQGGKYYGDVGIDTIK